MYKGVIDFYIHALVRSYNGTDLLLILPTQTTFLLTVKVWYYFSILKLSKVVALLLVVLLFKQNKNLYHFRYDYTQ